MRDRGNLPCEPVQTFFAAFFLTRCFVCFFFLLSAGTHNNTHARRRTSHAPRAHKKEKRRGPVIVQNKLIFEISTPRVQAMGMGENFLQALKPLRVACFFFLLLCVCVRARCAAPAGYACVCVFCAGSCVPLFLSSHHSPGKKNNWRASPSFLPDEDHQPNKILRTPG